MTDTVLITGASSGLGRAIALRLARGGDRVFGTARDTQGRNAGLVRELADAGIEVVEIDVVDGASVEAGVARVIAATGRIDVLVNCAGAMPAGITEAFSAEQLEGVLQTNLIGPFRMMKAVLPHMRRARSGLLVNISSIGGRMTLPGFGLYAASKWGLEGLAESIGYEVSKLGIDSVIVEPSLYLTELKAKGDAPEDAEVLDAYDMLSDMGERVSSRFRPAVAASGVSTDPATLAEEVERLIRMPRGERPIRATFGFDVGTAALNAACAPLQRRYMEMVGLEDMERVAR